MCIEYGEKGEDLDEEEMRLDIHIKDFILTLIQQQQQQHNNQQPTSTTIS